MNPAYRRIDWTAVKLRRPPPFKAIPPVKYWKKYKNGVRVKDEVNARKAERC